MLRVTVEIIPFGLESEKKTLGELEIWNTGVGDSEIGYYGATLANGDYIIGRKDAIRHKRGEGYWKLVRTVLKQLL